MHLTRNQTHAMKTRLFCHFALFCLLFTGCAEYTTSSSTGEKIPRYAGRIQIALYDPTPRQPKPDFEVFADAQSVKRPYRIIALLAHKANPEDEGLMMNAIAYRARKLGADGMIVLPRPGRGWKFGQVGDIGSGGSEEGVYRAHAIIFTDKP
jgi:hypothetical protein